MRLCSSNNNSDYRRLRRLWLRLRRRRWLPSSCACTIHRGVASKLPCNVSTKRNVSGWAECLHANLHSHLLHSEIVLLQVCKSQIGGCCCCRCRCQVASCLWPPLAINKVLYYAHSHLAAHPTTAAAAAATVACPVLFWGTAIIAHCAEKLVFATSHFHDFQSRSILIENIFKCNATNCCNIVEARNLFNKACQMWQ